ncbi:MAG: ABC transporter ATP-binding protein [Candidatus Rokuibacteriota bacterium]|nr:MAG: ABC transporter ATP-binding protein [Candidatus Rokubacteria bacterium]
MSAVELQDVVKRFGSVTAVDALSFSVRPGQCVSLLGPSGCGKTTTLRLIAGFEAPDRGTVRIAGRDMAGRRPYERSVGLVFQDYALFPHMTVEENVAYGMRQRGVARGEIPDRVRRWLEQVRLVGFERRRPSQLSGGEQQRVALARALAIEPDVLLLDEPLSNLDAKLRQELRLELKALLGSVRTTTIVVTHDQEEAITLSEHVIIVNRGRIEQQGAPGDVYGRPRNRFVAEFMGRTNWFTGRLTQATGPGRWRFESEAKAVFTVAHDAGREGLAVDVAVRPERMGVERDAANGAASADNRLSGRITVGEYLGADLHHWVRLESGERVLVVEKNVGQSLDPAGTAVVGRFDPRGCIVLPASGAAPADPRGGHDRAERP